MSLPFTTNHLLWFGNVILVALFFPGTTKAAHCTLDCNDRGFCNNGKCCCATGYTIDDQPYCTGTPENTGEEYHWLILRWTLIILNIILAIGSLFGLILAFKYNNIKDISVLVHIRKIVLSLLLAFSIVSLCQWSIDPKGYEKKIPFAIASVLDSLPFTVISSISLVITFHWLELHFELVKAMNSEFHRDRAFDQSMLIQESLDSFVPFRRFKKPLVTFLVVIYVLQIVKDVLVGFSQPSSSPMNLVWSGIIIFVCLAFTVCAFVFGKRLRYLIPPDVNKSAQHETYIIAAASLSKGFLFLMSVLSWSLMPKTMKSLIIQNYCIYGMASLQCIVLMLVFSIRLYYPLFCFSVEVNREHIDEAQMNELSRSSSLNKSDSGKSVASVVSDSSTDN